MPSTSHCCLLLCEAVNFGDSMGSIEPLSKSQRPVGKKNSATLYGVHWTKNEEAVLTFTSPLTSVFLATSAALFTFSCLTVVGVFSVPLLLFLSPEGTYMYWGAEGGAWRRVYQALKPPLSNFVNKYGTLGVKKTKWT